MPSPKTVIRVARHGETFWNAERRVQGHTDAPLSDIGRRQADALGQRLQEESFDAIVSSDLSRAFDTASAASGTPDTIVRRPALRERHLGMLQGMTWSELMEKHPEEYAQWRSGDFDWPLPGGESLRTFHERCVGALEAIARDFEGQRVLVVTHGGVLRVWFRHVVGLPPTAPRRWRLVNASLGTLEHGPEGWMLSSWGEVDHMKEMGFIPY